MSERSIRLTAPPTGYSDWLTGLKKRIHVAQQRASLAVNREMVLLYWNIGHEILTRHNQQGWGSKVIDRLAQDLCTSFPCMKGFSPRNLKYMRAFAEAWPDSELCNRLLHNCRGATMWSCSTNFRGQNPVVGTSRRRLNTVGPATRW